MQAEEGIKKNDKKMATDTIINLELQGRSTTASSLALFCALHSIFVFFMPSSCRVAMDGFPKSIIRIDQPKSPEPCVRHLVYSAACSFSTNYDTEKME